ncbi:YbaY family lipoprotein [Uliginosibacterium aquaticum]|uniref:YbaY family lipoprotein n=1 Tax=Uliginosibacterium aquaticum TaxID=2731212 RepID=A0ABX2IHQ0_9RHOO|nr:YbaY family lipoprotein [Uliginosibacterium aquaticum]NSL53903.1 YbaY family lipoprotein [Uliginosibacterium aquaticum]
MLNSCSRRLTGALLLIGSLFSVSTHAAEASLSGSATYRERIALPPNAIFEATLEDISRVGAPAELLGSSKLDPAGQPPFRFAIRYDPSRLNPAHSYTVRARITLDGQLLFTTDTIAPVLTRGHADTVELLLKRVARSQPAAVPSDASLVNTYWKLLSLNGEAVVSREGTREVYFVLNDKTEPGVSGFAGCNRFMGAYSLEDRQLKFSKVAATMMACVADGGPEQAFLAALGKVSSWRVSGQKLSLLDADGKLLAEFEARYMQ